MCMYNFLLEKEVVFICVVPFNQALKPIECRNKCFSIRPAMPYPDPEQDTARTN